MHTFMVVCTFKPDTVMEEVTAMAPEEMAQAKALRDEGLLSMVRVSVPRDKVFLEVSAPDSAGVIDVVERLPMSRWWDLDVYQIAAPV